MTKSTVFPRANGCITFNLGWRWAWQNFTLHGGPFPKYEPGPNTFGVNLRAEANHKCDVYFPIQDFSVPTQDAEQVAAKVALTIKAAMQGNDVYAGCMGGWGRTGLFLALIAKTLGEDDPVTLIRDEYASHAVETQPQEQYVADFDVAAIRRELQIWAWRVFVRKLWPF